MPVTPLLMFALLQAMGPGAPAPSLRPATELRRIPAAEAKQGVVADQSYVYAISNSEIAKIERRTGKVIDRWQGDPRQFIHMNSCSLEENELVCAASNYPNVPMTSSVEWFDTRKLAHVRSRSLGRARGSLTWLDWHQGSWWACFAHYDGKGGEPGFDHRWTTLVRLDRNFAEQESWLFPEDILDRFKPYSASGGGWGPDGLLYVTGHDRPELYVLRIPKAGSRLEHVATIPIPTNGQAIAWDKDGSRTLWSIERGSREAVASRIPPLPRELVKGR